MAKATADSPYRQDVHAKGELVPEIQHIGYDRFVSAQVGQLGSHRHPGHYELCYLISGSVEWWNDDGIVEVSAGDVYLTRPGEFHGGADTAMHPCELFWLIFRLPTGRDAATRHLAHAFSAIRRRVLKSSDTSRRCLESILHELQHPTELSAALARARFIELLVDVVRSSQLAADRPSPSPEIRAAIAWLQAHATDDVPIEDAAAAAGLRPSRFHERFAMETGFTPGEYRTRQRIGLARQKLVHSPSTVTQIALELGFPSSQYFATVFRRQTGLTPQRYRQTHQQP